MSLQKVWLKDNLQIREIPSIRADQGQGHTSSRETVQGCLPDPCSCEKTYIGETTRRLETRMKEHQEACCRGMLERSAVAEHAWTHHHPIKCEDTRVIDLARRPKVLQLKKALHIQTGAEELLNRDAPRSVVDTLRMYLMVELLFYVCMIIHLHFRTHTYNTIPFCSIVISFCCCILVPLLYYSVVTHVYILPSIIPFRSYNA